MPRGFSVSEEALFVFEAKDSNVEWYTKVTAAIQNAVQCHRAIYDERKRATTQTLGFPGGTVGKEPACQCRRHEMWVWSLSWEDSLGEDMATCSSILAWKIPGTEEPGGLQSMGSHRFWHNWAHPSFWWYVAILDCWRDEPCDSTYIVPRNFIKKADSEFHHSLSATLLAEVW